MAQEKRSCGGQAIKGNATLPQKKDINGQSVHKAILLVLWLKKLGEEDKLKSPGCAQLLTAEQMTLQACPPRLLASDSLDTCMPMQ